MGWEEEMTQVGEGQEGQCLRGEEGVSFLSTQYLSIL